jgi:hypothetical protein
MLMLETFLNLHFWIRDAQPIKGVIKSIRESIDEQPDARAA